MKKTISLLSAATIATGSIYGIFNYNQALADSITIIVNDRQIECSTEPYIENDRTYVPLRAVFEALGASVDWDSETQTITSSKSDGSQIILKIGSSIMEVGKDKYTCDAAPEIKNDFTMVPIRYVADAFDKVTEWDQTTKTVTISDRHIDSETEDSGDTAWISNKGTVNLDTLTVSGNGITVEGNKIKITKGGIFTVTGTAENGRITVNTDEKIKLILDNASITCSDGPAIYFKDCLKAFLELAPDSNNYLEDGSIYENSDLKATLYAKDDLDIQGSGSLTIKSNCNDGIRVNDTFEMRSGNIKIDAAQDGIHVNDGADLNGGNLSITAYNDGIQSEFYLNIGEDMNLDITTAYDGKKMEISENQDFGMMRKNNIEAVLQGLGYDTKSEDFLNRKVTDIIKELPVMTETEDNISSAIGLKSDGYMTINGGIITINSTDHCIKSGKDLTINSGILTLNSEYAKGVKCMLDLTINDGTINVLKSTEGLESKQRFTVNGGNIDVNASDDGFNLGGGTSFGGKGNTESINYTDMLSRYTQNLDLTTATMKDLLENANNIQNFKRENTNQTPQRPTDGSPMPPEETPGKKNMTPQVRENGFSRPDKAGMGGMPMGGGTSANDTSRAMTINGGNIHIIAKTDCLDSNGYLTINGGNLTLESQASGGGDTALDPDYGLIITGGTVQAVVNGSVSYRPSETKRQNIVNINMNQTITGGTGYTVTDSKGNVVLSFTPTVNYKSAAISSEDLKTGESYTFTSGDYTLSFTVTDEITNVGTPSQNRFPQDLPISTANF